MLCCEPAKKRVAAFFDCQNLFKSVKTLWGYSYPNFSPIELAKLLTVRHHNEGWILTGIHLYTGLHDLAINETWHHFWNKKLAAHKNQDSRVTFFTAPLRYSGDVAREKGVDIRIALDMVRMARLAEYDVALLFSQDNDFGEVAEEIRAIVKEKQRWIKIASAYPYDACNKLRGVNKTDWEKISKAEYDSCIDPTDYRPSTSQGSETRPTV
nr:NYN domain-containing protein [uncultured Fretibacterium sp.]